MVTGDNVKTAKAIAVECGILNSYADATEPNIIEGRKEKWNFLMVKEQKIGDNSSPRVSPSQRIHKELMLNQMNRSQCPFPLHHPIVLFI